MGEFKEINKVREHPLCPPHFGDPWKDRKLATSYVSILTDWSNDKSVVKQEAVYILFMVDEV